MCCGAFSGWVPGRTCRPKTNRSAEPAVRRWPASTCHDGSPLHCTRQGRRVKVAGSCQWSSYFQNLLCRTMRKTIFTTKVVSGTFLQEHVFALASAAQAEIALRSPRTYCMDGLDGHWIRLELQNFRIVRTKTDLSNTTTSTVTL